MKNLFVSYETALKLKEKGFDEPCFACYNLDKHFFVRHIGICLGSDEYTNNSVIPDDYGIFSAPLYQQVIDWFRGNYKIWICETPYKGWTVYHTPTNETPKQFIISGVFIDEAIEEALKLI